MPPLRDLVDLHSHILPGIDDGASDLTVALAMARAWVAEGVGTVACTPHILPGVYANTGPGIRQQVAHLQQVLHEHAIPLRLVVGSDNHVVPDLVQALRTGRCLTLADSRYVLVEPPHHVAPPRLDALFFELLVAGYVPILTHPERLTWIEDRADLLSRLVEAGAWLQITSGSLTGSFGRRALYWSERLLDDGLVHIIATDAHNMDRRPPRLIDGFEVAAKRVGESEAVHMVRTRPRGVVENVAASELPSPMAHCSGREIFDEGGYGDVAREHPSRHGRRTSRTAYGTPSTVDRTRGGGLFGRLRRIFE